MAEATDAVVIAGWREFMEAMASLPARYERALRTSLRGSAQRVVNAAKPYAAGLAGARAQGKTENTTSISVGKSRVRITWSAPQAGVLEFGKDYQRRNRSAGGTHTVHMLPAVATPRFAYRAWEEMQEQFGQDVLDELAAAAAATGFWELS